jgi:hypothetical protein
LYGKPLLDLCNKKEFDFIETSAAGSFLHSFYNGIEKILFLIYKDISENIPNDSQWHKNLLEKSFELTEKRPPIFKNEYKEDLKDLMSFRHFFRHTYEFQLDLQRLMPLLNKAEPLWKNLEINLIDFIDSYKLKREK